MLSGEIRAQKWNAVSSNQSYEDEWEAMMLGKKV